MSYLRKIFILATVILTAKTTAFALQSNNSENSVNEEEFGSIETFLQSDFVKTSVWPGLGPFNTSNGEQFGSSENNHLADPSGNQLNYSTVGKRLDSCQLELHGGSNEAQSMLNLQMSLDFLLEGLGMKAAQIHAVNIEVSKNKKILTGNNFNPVQVNIAPVVVSLQNMGVNEGTENSQYRVVIVNKNLTANATHNEKGQQETKAEKEETTTRQEVAENNSKNNKAAENQTSKEDNIEVAVASPREDNSQMTELTKSVEPEQADKVQSTANKVEVIKGSKISKQNTVTNNINNVDSDSVDGVTENYTNLGAAKPEVEAAISKPLTKDEQQKKIFQDVIQNWQNLKKTAVKERDVNVLGQALAGKALVRQTDAIKWLASNHKYYDMTPGGVVIEKVTPVLANKKYVVYAEVKEKTKYMDDANGQVIKNNDDTYKVNYTIEKIGQHWLITDSALVKPSAEKAAAAKSVKAAPKKSH